MTDPPRVSDYMATSLLVLRPDMEILHASQILLEHDYSGAPVANDAGKLVGVLSKKDCLRATLNGAYYKEWGGPVSAYMTVDIQTMSADLELTAAAEMFLASPYRRFPVVVDDVLVGQISRSDILKALIKAWSR